MDYINAKIAQARKASARDGKVRFLGHCITDGSVAGGNRIQQTVICAPRDAAETYARLIRPGRGSARLTWERVDPPT